MKNKQPRTKSKSTPGFANLLTWIACLGALTLLCSSTSAQNLFVTVSGASWGNPGRGSIVKFTPDGAQSTFAVGLNYPQGSACDSAGNLFVTDGSVIYKFTSGGVRTTFASGLNDPVGLAFDRTGNLFAADGGSGRILRFTPGGARSTFASGLNGPVGLAFDGAGNLFVTDGGSIIGSKNGHVYRFTPNGMRTTFASGFITPNGLAFDSANNLFLVDGGDIDGLGGAIYKFTPAGVRTTLASADLFLDEFGIAIDSANNLFVPDLDPGNIYKFTPAGVRRIFASIPSTFQTGVAPASLVFQTAQTSTPTLVNISTRGSVETGENVLIGGFIVSGSDSQQVIIRGLGSTLTSFGVPDALQDPMLELHNTTSMMTSNDDWQSAANASQIPANYRPADSRESAVMTTLQPGSYTAIMHGKNSTIGVGLLEVYSDSSALTNVSTRGFVGTGDRVLIGGFISGGGIGSIPVMIRALGPTLTQFGVSHALADPTLSVIDGNGNIVASNDNWKNAQQTAIQNSGFAPPNDRESAIITTLTNGNYTAIVSGKNGATGVGLVEVYKLH